MSNLQVVLFREQPTAIVGGKPLQLRPLARAMLLLLITEQKSAVSFNLLLDRLMPAARDVDTIRESLHRAKHELKPLLEPNAAAIQLRDDVQVDVHIFQRFFADIDFLYHGDERYIQNLNALCDLYGDGFLPTYNVQDDVRYELAGSQAEQLLDRMRIQLRNQIDQVLEYRLIYYLNHHQYLRAIEAANDWLRIDITDERAYLWLVRAHALNREPQAALRYARQLQERLVDDPSDVYLVEVETLIKAIETNQPLQQIYTRLLNPRTFVGRELALRTLKDRLLGRDPVSRQHNVTIVSGWPGVGKTAMVRVLANDPQVRGHFRDGVFPVSFGEGVLSLEGLQQVGRHLGLTRLTTMQEAVVQLQKAFANTQSLLLVDDVYAIDQIDPFRQLLGPDNALLVTTRFKDVAKSFSDEHHYRLPVLEAAAALELLLLLSPDMALQGYEEQAAGLVEALEYLPLALQVAARMLNERFNWLFLGQIKRDDLMDFFAQMQDVYALLSERDPEERLDPETGLTATLMYLLGQSVRQLPEAYRPYFARLGIVRAKPARVDLAGLAGLWRVENPVPVVTEFLNKGLLEAVSSREYQLHSLLRAYARTLLEGSA